MRTVPKAPKKNRKFPQKDYAVRPNLDEGSLETNTSLYLMLQRVGRRKDVLDVGCATGYFAKLMSSHDCNVAGLDSNAEAAEAAKSYCSRVFVADLNFTELADAVGGSSFDVIVFGDVLEHLRDPAHILDEARRLLRADGYVVASIPNIAHGAIRLALLSGDFNYQDLGVLDESHLRFFTVKTIDELFLEAGYEIAHIDRTKLPLFQDSELVPNVSRDDFTEEETARVERDPECDTLQFVVQAFPLTDEAKLRNITKRFISTNTLLFGAQRRLDRQEVLLEKVSAEVREAPFNIEAAETSAREQAVLKAEIARLTGKESELQQRVLELHAAHEEALAERTGQLGELQKEIAALTEDRDMWRDKVASDLPLVKGESEEAKRQLELTQAEIARLTDKELELQQRVLRMHTTHEEALAERIRQLGDLQKEIAALTEDRDMWRDKVASDLPLAKAELEEAKRQLELAQAEIARLADKESELQQRVLELQTTHEDLAVEHDRELASAHSELLDRKAALSDAVAMTAKMQAELDRLHAVEEEFRELASVHSRLLEEAATLWEALAVAEGMQAELGSAHSKLVDDAVTLREELNTVRSQRDSSNLSARQMQIELDLLRAVEEQFHDLASVHSKLVDDAATSREELDAVRSQRDNSSTLARQQTLMAQRLQQSLAQAGRSIEELQRLVDEMRKSRFWRARNAWFGVKRLFGIETDIM